MLANNPGGGTDDDEPPPTAHYLVGEGGDVITGGAGQNHGSDKGGELRPGRGSFTAGGLEQAASDKGGLLERLTWPLVHLDAYPDPSLDPERLFSALRYPDHEWALRSMPRWARGRGQATTPGWR